MKSYTHWILLLLLAILFSRVPVAHSQATPATTADGNIIAFVSNQDGHQQIYTINLDGTHETRLTHSDSEEMYCDISRDGRRIVFDSQRDGHHEIYIMNADGTGESRLTNTDKTTSNVQPSFSPDGKRIVFIVREHGAFLSNIHVMNTDGTNEISLTKTPRAFWTPCFTPDGSKIAVHLTANKRMEINLINPDSGEPVPVSPPGSEGKVLPERPAVSVDGKIAFTTWNDGMIYLMNMDGSNLIQLVKGSHPTFSPDGKQIAFMASRDGSAAIYMMNVDGTQQRKLGGHPSGLASLSWAHQGNFVSNTSNNNVAPGNAIRNNTAPLDATIINAGEIRLDGTIHSIAATKQSLVLDVTSYTLPGGKTAKLPTPKPKAVILSRQTLIYSLNDTSVTGNLTDLKVGDAAGVIGNDTGSGKELPARLIAVPLAAGAALIEQSASASAGSPSLAATQPAPVLSAPLDKRQSTQQVTSANTQIATPQSTASQSGLAGEGKIVFVSNINGKKAIYAMNPDGSQMVHLADLQNNEEFSAVSPDGTKVAFTSMRDGHREIYVMDIDGTHQTRLTNTDQKVTNASPFFSPDGKKIIFSSNPEGAIKFAIYRMNLDGSDQTKLNQGELNQRPRFSPDGGKIVFTSMIEHSVKVCVMNADGTNQTPLTQHSNLPRFPVFSPDGSKVAFCDTGADKRSCNIYVMNADGTGLIRLTTTEKSDIWPAFSPDGSKIAFSSDRSGHQEIYVMQADGTQQTNVTPNLPDASLPIWVKTLKLPAKQ